MVAHCDGEVSLLLLLLSASCAVQTVVPLNTWVLISNFMVAYNMLRRPDGTFDRDLAEFLDRRVPPNARPVEGVSSFDYVLMLGNCIL